VRRRQKISAVLPGRRRRQAQAFFVAIAAMVAAASAGADPGVEAKQAQAQQVLAQIDQIDRSLGPAVEAYNFANVKLRQIEGNLKENRQQLKLARSNLKVAQDSLALRLVAAYTSSTPDNSTLAVLLGSTSFEDLLTRIESIDSASQADASIVKQVTSFKAAIRKNRIALERAHSEQQRIVSEKAAQKQRIQSQLAARRQLLSTIRGQITQMRAAEAAQQRRLAAAAQSRFAGQDGSVDGVGVAAATAEGTIVAPPNTHGGVVGIAMRYLGVPYVWGGSSPRGFDCSGLVAYVFGQIGISLPHSTYALWNVGVPVSRDQLQAGDLVFFSGLGHMGIYIGGGQFIHAPHTGDVVKISSLSGYYASAYYGARRV
jgi:peptidoglycan DL-endopeptidase CwlO